MSGGRQRILLVLTLVLGVLSMHALVLVDAEHVGAAPDVAATSMVHGAPAHQAPVADPSMAGGADHPGHGPAPSMLHHVLHLCLAIMAALLVVGAVALVLWHTVQPDRRAVRIGALVRRAPRRPPSTSVRLAQLCVLRN